MKYTELGPFNGARQQSRAPKRGIFFKTQTTDRTNYVSPQHLFGGGWGGSFTGDPGRYVNEGYGDGHLSP